MGLIEYFTPPEEEINGYPLNIIEEDIEAAVGTVGSGILTQTEEGNVCHNRYFIENKPAGGGEQVPIMEVIKDRRFLWGPWLGYKEATPTDCVLAIKGGVCVVLKSSAFPKQ
jgi:hypothetical protein